MNDIQLSMGTKVSKKIYTSSGAMLVPSLSLTWSRTVDEPNQTWHSSLADVPLRFQGYETGRDKIQARLGVDFLLEHDTGISFQAGKTFQQDASLWELALVYKQQF